MRSEEDKVLQTPIKARFGGTEYDIKILCIKDNREWRKKFNTTLAALDADISGGTDANALEMLIVKNPDAAFDLVFAYAKDLKRDEIEGKATDKEIADVLPLIIEAAFPLAQSLMGAVKKLSR